MYDVGLFTVDEYISIAKEKHGYNTEQVGDCSLCACVCVCMTAIACTASTVPHCNCRI